MRHYRVKEARVIGPHGAMGLGALPESVSSSSLGGALRKVGQALQSQLVGKRIREVLVVLERA